MEKRNVNVANPNIVRMKMRRKIFQEETKRGKNIRTWTFDEHESLQQKKKKKFKGLSICSFFKLLVST